MIDLQKYTRVWWLLASNELQAAFINRGTNLLFLAGKLVRLALAVMFLLLIQRSMKNFAGYTPDQVIIFFLTYNLIDTLAQTLFRGVYMFAYQVRRGEFDFSLAKPVNALFVALCGTPDINDAIFLLPTIGISVWLVTGLDLNFSAISILWYCLLVFNGLLIAAALHILALVIGLLTAETDGVMWLYRDLSRLAQFPVTIYLEPLRLALFFLLPFGMMITIPSQALLGLPLSYSAWWAVAIGLGTFGASLLAWRYALRAYASAGG